MPGLRLITVERVRARMSRRWSLALALATATASVLVMASACTSSAAQGHDHGATTAHAAASTVSARTSDSPTTGAPAPGQPAVNGAATTSTPSTAAPAPVTPIAGMPAVADPGNLYSETTAGKLSPAVANAKQYVYVPSDDDGSITVIDQATMEVVDKYATGGKLVQHVVPSYDLTTLYANVSGASFLREIDPATGKPGGKIPVDAPYNLYFTPDGTRAIVMAERRDRIDFYDRATWKIIKKVPVPCKSKMRGFSIGGVNHADWSIDGKYFLATCEFAGRMIKVDTTTMEIVATVDLEGFDAEAQAMPQDVRITPDGKKFYVADMMNGGLWVIDGDTMTIVKRIATGKGAHGIYPSRDGTAFYISNRGHLANETGRRSRPGEGSVSVLDWRTDTVTATWTIDGGGSPDMGGVSADGKTLWLSGRYDSEVYAFDTVTGVLKARIHTASSPHGLCVFPQPGRYSLGHTGNYR